MALLLDLRVKESIEIFSEGMVSILLLEKKGQRSRLMITGDANHPAPKVSIRRFLSKNDQPYPKG